MAGYDLSLLSPEELLEVEFLLAKREEFEVMSEEEERRIAYRAKLEASPAEFFREAWKILEPGTDLCWSWHYEWMSEYLKMVFAGECRRLIINVPPRSAKALALDTLIPTPSGMRKMADVHPGDVVYGKSGHPCTVIAESLVFSDHECFEVEFSTGETVIADAGHLWNTTARMARPGIKQRGPQKGSKFSGPRGECSYKTRSHALRGAYATRTTQDIAETVDVIDGGKRRSNHRVEVCAPVVNEAKVFLVSPYVLGAWLGDGDSAGPRITCAYKDTEILWNIENSGEQCTQLKSGNTPTTGKYRIGPSIRRGAKPSQTLQHRLNKIGVLNNKHIPESYFHGSIKQRMELLRGLMDTDGTACKKSGVATFANTNERLSYDVKRLMASLGFKPSIVESEAKLDGRYISQCWKVSITAYNTALIFGLTRKSNLQPWPRKSLQNHRSITRVNRVDSVPVKCISVDNDDNLYLITEAYIPTHNSSYVTVSWPAWCWARRDTMRFLSASYAQGLSTDLSVKRRRLIESQWYRDLWDVRLSSDTNRKEQYSNLDEGEMIATSVGPAGAMGRGGNILILDDGFNASEVRSETVRKTTHEWFVDTFVGRLNDKSKDSIVVIEQRTHDDDMTGWLLRNEPGQWTHLEVPLEQEKNAVYTFPLSGRTHERMVGDVLQPQRNPPAVVTALKVHSRNFATQYQQRPAPDSGIVFKREWWKFRKTPRDRYDTILTSWDFAVEGKADSDFNVGVLLGKAGADIDVLDVIRRRIPFPEQQRALVSFHLKHPQAGKHLVEKKANGPAIIASLKNQVSGLIAVEPQGSKLQRYDAASPPCEAGNVYLLEAAWNEDFIEECAIAPNGANDDQCFVAGTMIATPSGDVRIEDIRIGDTVITPLGIGRVTNAGITGIARVITNRGLTGTAGHKVFSGGKFAALDALTQCSHLDTLSLCTLIRWRVLTLLSSMESSTGSWAGRGAIISASQLRTKVASVPRACMSLFGSMLMDRRFRAAMTFAIKMTISSTMTLAIWSRYRAASIVNSIPWSMISSSWPSSGRFRSRGIGLKRAAHGIVNTLRALFYNQLTLNVSGVKGTSPQSTRVPNTAAVNAGTNIVARLGTTTRSGNASTARPSSTPSSILTREGHVGSAAASAGEPMAVFNLSVQPDGVYYANGILVSNCDAFAQGIIYMAGRNYSYGLLGYVAGEQKKEEEAREEFMERAKNVGKIDTPDNALRCGECGGAAVVSIGNQYHCNGCSHNWPKGGELNDGLKNPAYNRGDVLRK